MKISFSKTVFKFAVLFLKIRTCSSIPHVGSTAEEYKFQNLFVKDFVIHNVRKGGNMRGQSCPDMYKLKLTSTTSLPRPTSPRDRKSYIRGGSNDAEKECELIEV